MFQDLGGFVRSTLDRRYWRLPAAGLALAGLCHLAYLAFGQWPARILDFYPLAALMAGLGGGVVLMSLGLWLDRFRGLSRAADTLNAWARDCFGGALPAVLLMMGGLAYFMFHDLGSLKLGHCQLIMLLYAGGLVGLMALAKRPPAFKQWLRANRIIYTLGALTAVACSFHFVLAGQ